MCLVLERCRRRLFLVENCVFGAGALPQAPFLGEKLCVWCWNVAAGAFFGWKIVFLVPERCRRRLFLVEKCVFGPGTLPQAPLLLKMKVNVSPFRKTIFKTVSHRNL